MVAGAGGSRLRRGMAGAVGVPLVQPVLIGDTDDGVVDRSLGEGEVDVRLGVSIGYRGRWRVSDYGGPHVGAASVSARRAFRADVSWPPDRGRVVQCLEVVKALCCRQLPRHTWGRSRRQVRVSLTPCAPAEQRGDRCRDGYRARSSTTRTVVLVVESVRSGRSEG